MNNSFFNDPGGPWNAGMMNSATAMGNGGTGYVGGGGGGWSPYPQPGGGGNPWNPVPQPGGGPGLMQMFGGGAFGGGGPGGGAGGGNSFFNDPGGPWNAGMMKGATPMGNGGPGGGWNPAGVGGGMGGVTLQSLLGLLNGPQGMAQGGGFTGGGPAAVRGYQGGPNRHFDQQLNKWQWNPGHGGNAASPIGVDNGMHGINMNSQQSPMGLFGGAPIQAPNQQFFVPKQGQTNWM